MSNIASSFSNIFKGFGVKDLDSEEIKQQKANIVSISFIIALLAILWGTLYFFYNLPVSGSIPYSYTILSLFSLAIFYKTKNLNFLRSFQLILLCFLPFFLTLSLGGFINSSVVILWSLAAPFGALMFADVKKAPIWFVFYTLLLLLAAYFDYVNLFDQVVSPDFIHTFMIINLIIIPFMLFTMMYYFVNQKNSAFSLLKKVMTNEFSTLITSLDLQIEQANKSVLLLVLDSSGLSIFNRFFTKETEYDEQLIGGFLTALNTFSKEAFGANFLKRMQYKDFYLMFDVIGDYRLVYAFKGDQISANAKFTTFTEKIKQEKFLSILQNRGNISLNNNQEINSLVNSVF